MKALPESLDWKQIEDLLFELVDREVKKQSKAGKQPVERVVFDVYSSSGDLNLECVTKGRSNRVELGEHYEAHRNLIAEKAQTSNAVAKQFLNTAVRVFLRAEASGRFTSGRVIDHDETEQTADRRLSKARKQFGSAAQ